MSYVYKRKRRQDFLGFGVDLRLARVAAPIPVESTPIVPETVVATTRSEYEVAPTLIRRELLEQPAVETVPTVPTAVVQQDPLLFPDAGWAPVPPPAPPPAPSQYDLKLSPYTIGPAPVVVEPLTVEPVDSVALSSRAVTAYPLDSQMSAADASLTQALQTRGLPSQGLVTTQSTNPVVPESTQLIATAPTEVASQPASAYTAPATDIRFTDPLRNPMNYVNTPERPDLEPDYTMIPKTAVAPAPAQTAYIEDRGLTDLFDQPAVELPAEREFAPIPTRSGPTTCPERFVMDTSGVCVPAPRPEQPDGRTINTCAAGYYWDEGANGCLLVPERSSDTIDMDDEIDPITSEGDTFSQELNTEPPPVADEEPLESEATASMMAQECNAKGGFYMYDPASGQNICKISPEPTAAPLQSETPWLLIGAGLLAAWFLLKE